MYLGVLTLLILRPKVNSFFMSLECPNQLSLKERSGGSDVDSSGIFKEEFKD